MTDQECTDARSPSGRRTFDLDPAEWLILWGFRYWVTCHCRGRSSWPLLSDVYGRNRVGDAAFCLDAVLRMTCLAATRSLDIRCPACPWVSPDEQGILSAIGHAQRGDNAACRKQLGTWLPATASRMALQMFVGLAQILADAGYRLRADAEHSVSQLGVAETGGMPARTLH